MHHGCEMRCSYVDMPVPTISIYTFGSPRVGNAMFASAYNAAVPDTWRVTNSKDYVPTVPKLLGYTHVDHNVLLDGKITYSILGASLNATAAHPRTGIGTSRK